VGWLQDLGSEFSIKRGTDLFKDPHKWAEHYLTMGMQSKVGPAALQFVPGVGGLASAASKEWLQHEARKGVYDGKTGQTPIQSDGASGATAGSAAGGAIGSLFGAGGAQIGGLLGGSIGGGGGSGAGTATASQVGGSTLGASVDGGGTGAGTGITSLGGLGSLLSGSASKGTAASSTAASGGLWALINSLLDQKGGSDGAGA